MRKCLITTAAALLIATTVTAKKADIELRVLGSYTNATFDRGAAEIVAHDPATQRLFVVNADQSSIDVLSIADPTNPSILFDIDVTPYGRQANSVDVRNGVLAAAVEANVRTDSGKAVFFDTDGNFLHAVTVGALPDMLTFTPDGSKVLVANEGEPSSYNQPNSVDPEGSVSIIDVSGGVANATVTTAGFGALSQASLDPSIRIFGPGASVAQDLEPEYIAVSHDSKTAWVTLQEANALGVLDLKAGSFTELIGLGFKNHNLQGNGIDASDRDNAINIANWPVFGMYQPDSIAAYKYKDDTYLVTANEGDARDYTGFGEEVRVRDLTLDPTAFPNNAFLKSNARLGRLNVTRALGDTDGDSDHDALYAFGARSFSIRKADGTLLFDSGSQLELLTSSALPASFNASNTNNTFEDRSDNKGPEPEGVVVGKAYGRVYAFIGLERIGGVAVYEITDPYAVEFVQYVNHRDFTKSPATETAEAGDLGPEGLHFIPAEESPTGKPLLVVANEISGSTTVYEVGKNR